jgi:hypothetical protein
MKWLLGWKADNPIGQELIAAIFKASENGQDVPFLQGRRIDRSALWIDPLCLRADGHKAAALWSGEVQALLTHLHQSADKGRLIPLAGLKVSGGLIGIGRLQAQALSGEAVTPDIYTQGKGPGQQGQHQDNGANGYLPAILSHLANVSSLFTT